MLIIAGQHYHADNCRSAIEDPPQTIKVEMQMMFFQLQFSQMVVNKLVKDQGIE